MSSSALVRNAYKMTWIESLPRQAPIVVANAPDYGFDLYVDSALGDDGNHGHSSDVPIRTLTEALTRFSVPGIKIGLACGRIS